MGHPSCLVGHRVLRFGSVRRLLDVVCNRFLEHWGNNRAIETVFVLKVTTPMGRLGEGL